jgi:hypothetical protein
LITGSCGGYLDSLALDLWSHEKEGAVYSQDLGFLSQHE